LIQAAQLQGFLVMLLVVCLDDTKRLLKRVANRVREGGHHVPSDRILARYPRTLSNLAIAVRQADAAILYDSHAIEAGTHKAVAVCKAGLTQVLVEPLPQWAQLVLGSESSGQN
jgi:predicted ABC-type ATPase